MERFDITFYGTRGSSPAAGPTFAIFGGNTPCLALRLNDRLLILDAGTGIIPLGQELKNSGVSKVEVFITHAHYDHVQGLPFFAPLMLPEVDLTLWFAGSDDVPDGHALLDKLFRTPFLPFTAADLGCNLITKSLPKQGIIDLGAGVMLTTAPINHPGGCTAFRFDAYGRSFVYAPDFEHDDGPLDAALVEFMKDASFAVLDATYTLQEYANYKGFGHTHWEQSIRLGQRADLGSWALFHHSFLRTDAEMTELEQRALDVDCRVIVAHEGQKYSLLDSAPSAA